MRSFFYRRLIRPIVDLLRQGVTPEKVALSIVLGVAIGIFPGIGWTTLLCLLATFLLRLNPVAIQAVNYFMYPAQLALLIPFIRGGEWLFREHSSALTVEKIFALIRSDMIVAIRSLWTASWHAMVVWLIVVPLPAALLYAITSRMLRRAALRMQPAVAR